MWLHSLRSSFFPWNYREKHKEKAPSYGVYCLSYLLFIVPWGRQTFKDINNVQNLSWCYISQPWSPYSVKISTEFSIPFGDSHLGPLVCFCFCSSCPVSPLFTVSPLLRYFWICPVFLALCLPSNLVATWASLLLTLGSLWGHVCYWLLTFSGCWTFFLPLNSPPVSVPRGLYLDCILKDELNPHKIKQESIPNQGNNIYKDKKQWKKLAYSLCCDNIFRY